MKSLLQANPALHRIDDGSLLAPTGRVLPHVVYHVGQSDLKDMRVAGGVYRMWVVYQFDLHDVAQLNLLQRVAS